MASCPERSRRVIRAYVNIPQCSRENGDNTWGTTAPKDNKVGTTGVNPWGSIRDYVNTVFNRKDVFMINQETKVGLFVLIGIVIFAVAVVLFGDVNLQKGYELKVVFDSAEGLSEQGQVKMAGVEVGKVKEIALIQNKALVTINMKPKVKIYRDATAKIVSVGMVGNKFLEMTAGTNTEPALVKGDVIIGTNSVSLDSVIENANVGIDSLIEQFKIFEKNGKLDTTLTQIAFNVEEIVSKLNGSLGKNGESIKSTVKNINTISEDLNQISERIKGMQLEESVLSKLIADKKLGEKVESIINNLEKVSKNMEKRFR